MEKSKERDPSLKIIKTIEPQKCPHCGKDIFISAQSAPATITNINTQQDVKDAKEEIKKRLEEINFYNLEDKEQIIDWLEDEETLIDFSDVESVIKQISIEQLEKSNNEKEN